MTPDRWRQVSHLYHAALARPEAGRDAFVRAACGEDEPLRREVASLLAQPESAAAFLSAAPLAQSTSAPGSEGLAPGTRLGPFVVLGLIGEGGMGRVYRACDDRLKRDVALKVLPDTFAADRERAARFQREAEILASLTHQNIAALYGLEETDDTRALVMELVEGPTLAERIARGAIPVEDALPIATQIVEALDYAHEKGILHRDLKPANVKVTPDGQVKVLDFGLAKALEPDQGSGLMAHGGIPAEDAADSPTITTPATQPGVIVGTVAYMAPEQVRGRPLDRRADIWAFGCVVFEMLTGQRAFERATVPDTLAAVLTGDPGWARMPAGIPVAVNVLIHHCLEPDLKARLRHIADARLVLAAQPPAQAAAPALPTRMPRRRVVAIAGALAAMLSVAAWSAFRSATPPRPSFVRRVTIQLPVELSRSTSGGSNVAVAPDGRTVAAVARVDGIARLFLHHLEDGTTTPVVQAPALQPTFSPDGRAVAFVDGQSVWRLSVGSGEAERLCSVPVGAFNGFRGGSWGEDGRIVYGSTMGLLQAGEPGAACELVVPLDAEREARFLWPQVLPRGRGILVTASGVSDDPDSASIVVVRPGDPARTILVRGARGGRVTASGHLVFARGNRLLAAPFDLDALRLAGDPVVVLDGVAYESFGGATASLSDAGDLVYAPGTAPRRHLVWVTRDGRRAATGSPLRDYQPDVRLSPDGRHVAVPVGTGDHVAWVFTFDSGTLTPLFSRSDAHGYAWSPDSRRMAIPWYTKGLVIADRDLAREPDVVVPIDARSLNVWTWSPQGSTVVYSVEAATSRHDLIALNVGDRTSRTLLSAPQGGFQAAFSPDGRWLAYVESAAGRRNVFVTDYPGLRLKTPVSIDAGVAPVWSHDGRELFYLRGMTMMSATRRAGDDLAFGRPVELFETALPPAGVPYSVASDGRFLMVEDADPPSVSSSQLTLVLNWFDELRRLVPR